MSLRLILIAALVATLAAPAAALAETVTVNGFNSPTVQAFDKTGASKGKIAVKDFGATPITSSVTGPANSVGLPYQGDVVFVRRLDLRLGGATCLAMNKETQRGVGVIQAGERMGAGGSTDCLVQ